MLYERLENENEILKEQVNELTKKCDEQDSIIKKLKQDNVVLDEANKILILENTHYKAYMHLKG